MTADATTRLLAQDAARKFVEHYRIALASAANSNQPGLGGEVLDAVAAQGWLSPMDDDGNSTDTASGADLLAAIVAGLAHETPALAVRLLAHHFCVACVDANRRIESVTEPLGPADWLGLEAATTSGRFAPTLELGEMDGRSTLRGSLRFVIGGDRAKYWLSAARGTDGQRCLVLVDSRSAIQRSAVRTLGLCDLGVTDATFTHAACCATQLVSHGQAVPELLRRAHRAIGPGYTALVTALLERTQRIAVEHARTRRQYGSLIQAIPAVQLHLGAIERAIALTRATSRMFEYSPGDACSLLQDVRAAALRATDAGIQILGGAGYVVGTGAERIWRDTRQLSQLLLQDPW